MLNLSSAGDKECGGSVTGHQASIRQLELMTHMERFLFDQSTRPKRGDFVSFFHGDFEDCMRVGVIGTQKPSLIHCQHQIFGCGLAG